MVRLEEFHDGVSLAANWSGMTIVSVFLLIGAIASGFCAVATLTFRTRDQSSLSRRLLPTALRGGCLGSLVSVTDAIQSPNTRAVAWLIVTVGLAVAAIVSILPRS